MFQKARESAYLESTSLLLLLIKWRKPLIIVLLLASAGAFIFSGPTFIAPRYKSTVIFFPSATNSVSKALLEDSPSEKQDILAFGEEEQAEQMLQMLNSDEIRSIIIKKYDLLNHYRIDKDKEYPMTRLHEKFSDNISFSRTEFLSVRIQVLDEDAQIAANIANDIASLLDSMKIKIQRTRAGEALNIVKKAYENKLRTMKVKEDSLLFLREQGVMDFESQSKILNKEYADATASYANEKASLGALQNQPQGNEVEIVSMKARLQGSDARVKNLKEQLNTLAKYGGASVSLNGELLLEREELLNIKAQYDKLSVDAEQNLTSKFIVNEAVKAEKKSFPVRWLVVLITVIVTFLLSITVILTFEKIKEIRYNMQ